MLIHYIRVAIGIALVSICAFWVAWPGNPGIHVNLWGLQINRELPFRQGLDLQGGMQVLLEADVPPGTEISAEAMQVARQIIDSRVNHLGVVEPVIQIAEGNRIIVELPGIKDPDQAIRTFGETGLLEFVDAQDTPLPVGALVTTSLGPPGTSGPTLQTDGIQTNEGAAQAEDHILPDRVFPTIMQGSHIRSAEVGFDEMNRPEIRFTLTDEGAQIFGNYTTANVHKFLAITMDKRVLSSPRVESPITGGSGRITGGPAGFPLAEAQSIVIQLRYGSLPVPLRVVQNRTVGPTLGQDSLQKSLVAGVIGFGIVASFMLAYYRLPGVVAVLALTIYTAIVLALFKLIPVTLTLAGIAGFILSIGMAVDANILIFERMKEELRAGRTLRASIDTGFDRAWTSIRDSNVSTMITCGILFWFGMSFGASIIQGFALTLFIGVLVSMFTAIVISRTFLHLLLGSRIVTDNWWYGLQKSKGEAR